MDPRADVPQVRPRSSTTRVRTAAYHPRVDEVGPSLRRFGDTGDTAYRYFEPPGVREPPPPVRRRVRTSRQDLGITVLLTLAFLAALGAWNVLGGATNAAIVLPTGSPRAAVVVPSATSRPSATPDPTATPEPTATPLPPRVPVDTTVNTDPKAVFITEQEKTWCAAAAVQMVLNVNGPDVDVTADYQGQIRDTEVALTTHADSLDGGVGPLGMVATLNEMGSVQYELRIYSTRAAAITATARAITATGSPVVWLAWWGAHAWVITGYRATADPVIFPDAAVQGVYVLDPWYPRVSSIWGRSDPPGTFQDAAEMKRNFPAWKRPEGRYPTRDGKFLVIIPVDAPE